MSRSMRAVLALLAVLLELTCVSPDRARAQSTGPDFSAVTDVLQGRRRLLPVDDLVVTSPTGAGGAVQNVILPTTSSTIGAPVAYGVTSAPAPSFVTAIGRMVRSPRDVVFTMTNGTAVVRDQNPAGPITTTSAISGNPVNLATADFNGDGFADIALLTATSPGATTGLLRIVSASDTGDLGDGLFVSTGVSPASTDFSRPIAIAAGNFGGGGRRQVVLAQPLAAGGSQYVVQIYDVLLQPDGAFAPQALALAVSATFSSVRGLPIRALAVLAGNFDAGVDPAGNLPQDELAVVMQAGPALVIQGLRASIASTGNSITSVGTFLSQDTLPSTPSRPFVAIAAHLDWFSAADQVVVAYQSVTNGVQTIPIGVFVSDSQLNWSQTFGLGLDAGPVLALAPGNFDQSAQSGPPNLQLAAVTMNNPTPGYSLVVLNVLPAQGFALSLASNTPILPGVPASLATPFALAAGDLQGRSLLLGPPSKITITHHYQPEVVIGAPPMHVDWVTPDGVSPATVFNVSAIPHGFFSSYQTAVSQQEQSTSKSTTSFTYATRQTASVDVSLGVPLTASVDASLTVAAQQTHDNVVASVFDTYGGEGFDVSTQTGFDDHLWFSGKRFNVYAYPVIGRCIACADAAACAAATPTCPAGQAPLVLQFSGPDFPFRDHADAANVEWYQPVHEVGQIFSYPWSLTQLAPLYPGFDGLNCGDPACRQSQPATHFTDGSIGTQQTTWSNGTSSEETSGSAATSSFDTTASVSSSVTAAGDMFEAGGGGALSFSYGTSASFATLFSGQQQLGQSTGVGIAKPGTFQDPPTYQYAWQPFIFGQSPPAGTVQTLSLGTDVVTSGPLRTAFTANPLDPVAGQWWTAAYTAPDVALHHPARWILSTQTSAPNQPPPANCRRIAPTSTTMDCFAFDPPTPTDVTASGFYWMKGLLITTQAANGQGPLLTQTTAGQTLSLQARVYNYSVADMPAGTVVHAQFYGQPVDPTTSQFTGPSFFIGEDQLAPIPGFSGSDDGGFAPNWAYASTLFDTSGAPDTYLVFWVVVWMQTSAGLVAEMPGHGLTAIPAPGMTSIAQVPVQAFSNNVGYFRQPIYIAAPGAPAPSAGTGRVAVHSVSATPAVADPLAAVKIRASIRSVGGTANGVAVFFYDGDPGAGGRLFDVELIPHIRRDAVYATQVVFRPPTCGGHTIVAVAQSGSGAVTAGATTLQAGHCAVTTLTGSATRVGDATDNAQVTIAGRIALPPPAATPNLALSRVAIQSLLAERGGAGELVDRVAAGAVTLLPRAGGKPTAAIFESSPASARPSFRMEVRQASPGQLDFSLRVDRATLSHDPERCTAGKTSTTVLTTTFAIDGGPPAPVTATASLPWQCAGKDPRAPTELRRK